MKITIFCLGKLKQNFIKQGEEEFLKRLKPQLKLEIVELNSDRFSSLPEQELRKKEAELLIKNVNKNDLLVLLDENGREFNSKDFAKFISQKIDAGKSIAFAIGGAYGWDEEFKSKQQLISLSQLTFTYQFSRLILVEQIYRAISLIKGLPYHK